MFAQAEHIIGIEKQVQVATALVEAGKPAVAPEIGRCPSFSAVSPAIGLSLLVSIDFIGLHP
jgi:hypothetical protein